VAAQAGDMTQVRSQGMMMGLYATGGDLGSAAGPLVAYSLATAIDLRWVYLFCAGLFLAALGLTWQASRRVDSGDASSMVRSVRMGT
jgi:MFS family permease